MEFYISERINDNMILIRSASGELLYLIEGEDKAILIDACLGVGHLEEFVNKLTSKPITVLLTHGHVDHAPGAVEFADVYLNPKDQELYQHDCRIEERKGYLQANLGPKFTELTETDYAPEDPLKKFHELYDGICFDLGGIHVEGYELPGHTMGSMVLLVPECRILILGDACNNATFLFMKDSCSVSEYLKNISRVSELLQGRYDSVYISHYVMEQNKEILKEMTEVCEDILHGNADDEPFEFMGMQAYIAKKCNEQFVREDGKSANLIYSKDKV